MEYHIQSTDYDDVVSNMYVNEIGVIFVWVATIIMS